MTAPGEAASGSACHRCGQPLPVTEPVYATLPPDAGRADDLTPSVREPDSDGGDRSGRLEDVVRRFEDAWRGGTPPALDAFLPADPSLRTSALVELIHADLELRVRAGQPARVQAYFDRYPELTDLPPAERGPALHRKLRVDLTAGIPRGLWLGLFPLLLLCVPLAAAQTAAAGHLLRTKTGVLGPAGSYTEFAVTSLMLLNVSFTAFVRPWFDSRVVTGLPYPTFAALTLLQLVPMALALLMLVPAGT